MYASRFNLLSMLRGGIKTQIASYPPSQVDYGSAHKLGGVLQIAVNNWASRIIATYSDPLGCFTSQTFIGKNGAVLTAIAASRVVDGSSGPSSASSQQKLHLTQLGRRVSPRKAFIEDMEKYIKGFQEQRQKILLCLDANKSFHCHNLGIRQLATNCGLMDVHENLFPGEELPLFKQGSSKIDFCLTSQTLFNHIIRAGILPFDVGFTSNHRVMFLDLDIKGLFLGVVHNVVGLA